MLIIITGIIGSVFILLGFAGSLLPVLPGPPLSFIGLLLLAIVQRFSPPLTLTLILILAMITVIVSGLDYAIPSLGAKRYGASRWGIWGSVAGMLIGIFFFPPFGMLIGAFIGAIAGELLGGKRGMAALRAGQGILMGILFGAVLKLAVCGVMTYYFIRALF
jgi:uncharacterized protein YqgC (DUF456 family)